MNHHGSDTHLHEKLTSARLQYRSRKSPAILHAESLLARVPRNRFRIGFRLGLVAAAAMMMLTIVINQRPSPTTNPSPPPMTHTALPRTPHLSVSGLHHQIRNIERNHSVGDDRSSENHWSKISHKSAFPNISSLHNKINALRKERHNENITS